MQTGAAEGMGGAYGQAGVNTGNIYSTLGGQQATSAEQLSRDLAANVMSQGAYASGVPGQTYTPVNAYNPASPLIAGGMAYDWAQGADWSKLFGGNAPGNAPAQTPPTGVTMVGGYAPPAFPDRGYTPPVFPDISGL